METGAHGQVGASALKIVASLDTGIVTVLLQAMVDIFALDWMKTAKSVSLISAPGEGVNGWNIVFLIRRVYLMGVCWQTMR